MKNASLTEVTKELATIPNYGGGLASWAWSSDRIDTWIPEAIRAAARRLAHLVVEGELAEENAYLGLAWICQGDEWAESEVSARFKSAVRRFTLIGKIRRHPRADKFASLIEAVGRGRATKPQMALAAKLAAEV